MYKNKKFIGIIPAKSNSKRLPNKNIKMLHGKHLIGWSIDAAKNSKYIDEVIVSTDENSIIDIAKKYGANIPFKRPKELTKDCAKKFDVSKHAVEFYRDNFKIEFDYVVLLQPTSPLRTSEDIDLSIEKMFENKSDGIISVCEADHILWTSTLPDDMNMSEFLSGRVKDTRSQDIEKYYRLNGAIFICDRKKMLEQETFFLDKNIYAYEMGKSKSIDIDTQYDFELAEFLISKMF